MPQIGACCNSMRNPVKLFVFEGLAGFPPFFSRDAASTASARHGDIRCKSVIITGTDRILGGVAAGGFNCRGLLSKQDLSRLSVKLVEVQCHPSATTMTWSDDHDGDVMIWTRPGGTADDHAGTRGINIPCKLPLQIPHPEQYPARAGVLSRIGP